MRRRRLIPSAAVAARRRPLGPDSFTPRHIAARARRRRAAIRAGTRSRASDGRSAPHREPRISDYRPRRRLRVRRLTRDATVNHHEHSVECPAPTAPDGAVSTHDEHSECEPVLGDPRVKDRTAAHEARRHADACAPPARSTERSDPRTGSDGTAAPSACARPRRLGLDARGAQRVHERQPRRALGPPIDRTGAQEVAVLDQVREAREEGVVVLGEQLEASARRRSRR